MLKFFAEESPSDRLCDELEELRPTIPYYSSAYRNAMQACDRTVWMVGLEDQGRLADACLAEFQSGRVRRRIHIQSTPDITSEAFWSGLANFCRRQKITTLSLGTVGTCPEIPTIGRAASWNARSEFWVDLQVSDFAMELRPQQRRVFRKAKERGLGIRVPEVAAGLTIHRELTSHSLDRRRYRGEEIPLFDASDVPRALIEAGVGQIYECVLDGEVLGSVIFTVSKLGAHGYSAGFSRNGMRHGAAVFLNVSTFELMRTEKKVLFNLGDAPVDSGLATFKRGLGGEMHESRAVRFDMGPLVTRILARGAAWVDGLRR